MTGDGKLQVEVYDGTARPGAAVAPLEVWQFDPDTMQRLLKRDFVGWGYTIPLVWPDLSPTVRSVRVKVCYQPSKRGAAVLRGRVDDDRVPRPERAWSGVYAVGEAARELRGKRESV